LKFKVQTFQMRNMEEAYPCSGEPSTLPPTFRNPAPKRCSELFYCLP
jgi:hypothetical protein